LSPIKLINVEKIAKIVVLMIVLLAVIGGLMSCATNGYGCKGRAKEPTGTVGKRWKAM
jgi:hypothetical protein